MRKLEDLKIKVYSDGAGLEDFRNLSKVPYIQGFTTNPSLMRKANVTDYLSFVKEVLPIVSGKSISFEVVCDDFKGMRDQAMKLASYGKNVYVKIPITNTKAISSIPLIDDLTHHAVNVNVTAILTLEQVEAVAKVLEGGAPAIVSVFAGRIADTGIDPIPLMKAAKKILQDVKNAELLWASTREILNIIQADEAGCAIITVPPDILKKASLLGYDLAALSLDTVKQFCNDAASSGLKL